MPILELIVTFVVLWLYTGVVIALCAKVFLPNTIEWRTFWKCVARGPMALKIWYWVKGLDKSDKLT